MDRLDAATAERARLTQRNQPSISRLPCDLSGGSRRLCPEYHTRHELGPWWLSKLAGLSKFDRPLRQKAVSDDLIPHPMEMPSRPLVPHGEHLDRGHPQIHDEAIELRPGRPVHELVGDG